MVDGKKSYIIAVCMVVTGLYTGDMTLVLEGLAVAGLRHGISK